MFYLAVDWYLFIFRCPFKLDIAVVDICVPVLKVKQNINMSFQGSICPISHNPDKLGGAVLHSDAHLVG